MPHILLKDNFILNTPSILEGGVEVSFVANGKYDQKIGIKKDGLKFLLLKKKTDDGYLLKYDKYSRISPINHIKSAINEISKNIDSEILFSNIAINNNKIAPKEEFLKDIEYFIKDFKFEGKICVEVGFGSGRHILHQAINNPDILFIGLEIHSPSIEQVLKQLKIQNIKNILIINYDARLFLEFIKSNSLHKIFVHFPVPWPKKPHRRVFSEEFILEAIRALEIGGKLELRTDDDGYFEFAENLATKLQLEFVVQKNQDLSVTSKYETRWKKQNKTIYDLQITSTNVSDQITIYDDFSFGDDYDFQKIKHNFLTDTLLQKNCFVHFEEIYEISENWGLLQVSMGSQNKPESKYIEIKDKKASYYQSMPTPSKTNYEAHKIIMERIK